MECPHCEKEMNGILDVRTGTSTIEYLVDRNGEIMQTELTEVEFEENVGYYCPYCNSSLDREFVEEWFNNEEVVE